MIIYILPIIALIVAYFAYLFKIKKLAFYSLFFVSISIISLAGLRWNCDADFSGYIEMYNEVPSIMKIDFETIKQLWGEPGYIIVSSVFKTLGLEFYYLSFFCVFLSISLKTFVSAKLSRQASLTMCLYLCVHFLTIEFIQIRWAIASSVLIFGFYSQYKGFLWTALFCFLAAVSLHYFSAIFILVALLIRIRNDNIFYAILLIGTISGMQITQNALSSYNISSSGIYVLERTSRYLGEELSNLGLFSYFKLYFYLMIYGLFYSLDKRKEILSDSKNQFLMKLSMACIALTLLCSFMPLLHHRAVVLADFFSTILIINFADSTSKINLSRIVLLLVVLVFSVWYLLDLNNNFKAESIQEYQTWLKFII